MAKYDQGGGCACGLQKRCDSDCSLYEGPATVKDGIFDFGFSMVSEDSLPSTQASVDSKTRADELDIRLKRLYTAILPLLASLRENPDSDYILWPNRTNKINEFETKITKIVDGDY